jgi:hypothetical protein
LHAPGESPFGHFISKTSLAVVSCLFEILCMVAITRQGGNADTERHYPVRRGHSGGSRNAMMTKRRFNPPWTVEETLACYIVKDECGQKLAYVYIEDEPGRQAAANQTDKV